MVGKAEFDWLQQRLSRSDVLLFPALARTAERVVSEFKMQNLASVAWAFVKVSQSDALLFAALAGAAERPVHDVNMQEVSHCF